MLYELLTGERPYRSQTDTPGEVERNWDIRAMAARLEAHYRQVLAAKLTLSEKDPS